MRQVKDRDIAMATDANVSMSKRRRKRRVANISSGPAAKPKSDLVSMPASPDDAGVVGRERASRLTVMYSQVENIIDQGAARTRLLLETAANDD